MSFGDPNNPYGQQQGQPGSTPPGQPGYGYPQQAPQGVPQQGYGYPQQPGQPYGYPQAPGQGGYGSAPSYANWGQRFLGTLVDGLVFLVPYLVALLGFNSDGAVSAIFATIGALALIGIAIWQLIKEGRTGQTIGKKAVGIRLVREADGQPLGVGMAFVRRLAHFLDSLPCYLGWLWPAWDEKSQTFADKICSSIVIRTK